MAILTNLYWEILKKKKKTLPIIVDVVTVWYKSIAFKAIIHTYIDTLRRVSFKKV